MNTKYRSFIPTMGLFVALAIVPFSSVFAESDISYLKSVSSAFRDVSKKVKPSVVTIETTWKADQRQVAQHPFFRHFGPQELPPQKGAGSGVIYDTEGHIITNSHVIDGADKIEVILNDKRRFDAELVGKDPKTDLALLKIEAKDLIPAKYGDSDVVEVGDWAVAIGNPLGFSQTVTVGIISAKGRHGLRQQNEGAYEDFIQTDASINQGNSGGPLCNLDSEVIGINSMIASQSGGSQGLGFTIPVNMAKNIVEQLINSGEIKRGFLGVQIGDVSKSLAQQFGFESTDGAFINEVVSDSPAEAGGLEIGDIIVELEGKKISSSHDLRNSVSQKSPGTTVSMEIFRNAGKKTIEVTLGSLDGYGGDGSLLGMSLRSLKPEEGSQFRSESGLFITAVKPESPAVKAGLQAGMVIISVDRKNVSSVEDFRKVVSASLKEQDKEVLLYVKTPSGAFFTVVKKTK